MIRVDKNSDENVNNDNNNSNINNGSLEHGGTIGFLFSLFL